MRKMIIGILPQILIKTDDNPYNDKYEFLDLYSKRVLESGGIPVGICLNNGILDKSSLTICDAFILPGGNKIWDCYYEVISYALENNKPLLGICLGFQALAIYSMVIDEQNNSKKGFEDSYKLLKDKYDGNLLRKIENDSHRKEKLTYLNVDKLRHNVNIIDSSSYLFDIYERKIINSVSLHYFTPKEIGSKFRVTAYADDGIVEGIEYTDNNYFIVGVCFHPEWDDNNKIFKRLILEAYKKYEK